MCWHSADLNVCVCLCLWVTVCVCADWSVRWCGGLSWRSKGDAGGWVRHLPCHRIRRVSHHLLGRVQNTRTRASTHTYTHTRPHTAVHKHTEVWRAEMKYPPHQSCTKTWRPRPGDHDHTSDHMTLGYRCAPDHAHKCTHTLAHLSVFVFSPHI